MDIEKNSYLPNTYFDRSKSGFSIFSTRVDYGFDNFQQRLQLYFENFYKFENNLSSVNCLSMLYLCKDLKTGRV